MLDRYEDEEKGGFFFTADNQSSPVQRMKIFTDDWYPAGNAVATISLLSLGARTNNPRYREAAEKTLKAGMSDTKQWPSAHATMVRALTAYQRSA